MRKYDFNKINKQAEPFLLEICEKYLPDGQINFDEYTALNPNRHDSNLGSFKINTQTGLWADFATDDKGCGAISLLAYVLDIPHINAAKETLNFLKGHQNEQ